MSCLCGCPVASSRNARVQAGSGGGAVGAGAGAVSRMKRSSAATTAAASSGEADGAMISSFGLRFATYRIMPAPTVSFVDSSMRMNEPVARLRA